MAAVVDKYIFIRLSEAVESLTRNNASLTAQLTVAMRLNLDMARKLKFKPMQEPEDKRLTEKEKRKA